MTKLSEKDQELIDSKSKFKSELHPVGVYICAADVQDHIIQKDAEHKSELKRLNDYIAKMQVDQVELIKKERARWQKEDLDALAQHDKQVKIDAVVHFCAWLVDNGEPIAEEELQVIGSKFINKIKEQ